MNHDSAILIGDTHNNRSYLNRRSLLRQPHRLYFSLAIDFPNLVNIIFGDL